MKFCIIKNNESMRVSGWVVWYALGTFQLFVNLLEMHERGFWYQAFLWLSMTCCYVRPWLGDPKNE